MCYCIIVYMFRYRDLYIGRSPVDQCFHVLLNKYVLHQMARNVIQSEFRTSKMADVSHFVKKKKSFVLI